MQTVSGSDLKINSIVGHWPGSKHDQRIFNTSVVKSRFEKGEFSEFILVGDSGYQNTMILETPLLETINRIEELYNENQIRTRNVVERGYPCAVLHNICIDQQDEWEAESEENDEIEIANDVGASASACNVRNELLRDYFPRLLEQTK